MIIKIIDGVLNIDGVFISRRYNVIVSKLKNDYIILTNLLQERENLNTIYIPYRDIDFSLSVGIVPSANIEEFALQLMQIMNALYPINSGSTTTTSTTSTDLQTHIDNTSNPHQVTKAQVGLSVVDNTSDADKPLSTATQQEFVVVKPHVTINAGSIINLAFIGGNYCNRTTPNANTTYTTINNTIVGGFAIIRINAANEPTVTGGVKLSGSDFVANTNMDLWVRYDGVNIEYFFSKL